MAIRHSVQLKNFLFVIRGFIPKSLILDKAMKIVFVFYSLKVRVLIFSLDISSTLFIALKNLRESKN